MNNRTTDRILFDDVVESYAQARPGYPPALIDQLVAAARLRADARILEIGCGTGQLTLPLAQRGYEIVGVELGSSLAARAAEELRGYPKARIIRAAFETWPESGESPFDLVVSAQAFHWIDPATGHPKARRLLRDDGHIALVYNLFPGGDGPLYEALDAVYRERFPRTSSVPLDQAVRRTAATLHETGLFDEPEVWQWPWETVYDTDRYLTLLNTFSDHRALPEAERGALFDAVRAVIDRFGGRIVRPLVATLFVAAPTLAS